MEIEKYIFASKAQNLLKTRFRTAMQETSDTFVDRPKTLSKTTKMKLNMAPEFKKLSENIDREINRRTTLFESIGGLNVLEALDYAVRSMLIENNYKENGAIYGEKAYNFCVDPLKIPKKEIEAIENTALEGFNKARLCEPDRFPRNQTEIFLNEQNLKLNGARVDIIQTTNGPKIIEINFQWVDGIQALEALKINTLGLEKTPPTNLLSGVFKNKGDLGIVFLNPASGSRELGEFRSLEFMAKKFISKNIFSRVEIINPESIRPDYLSSFKSLYIDGDPKMITGSDIPDWLIAVYNQARLSNITIFPNWNPQFDKKSILVEASERWPEFFAKTYLFSDFRNLGVINEVPGWVIKGDGFSSRQVAISQTELFSYIYEDALLFPNEYVLQPKLQSISTSPIWAFDTSASKPVYLENPNCKYNVWIINGKIAGTVASLSQEDLISDKDFNTIPTPC